MLLARRFWSAARWATLCAVLASPAPARAEDDEEADSSEATGDEAGEPATDDSERIIERQPARGAGAQLGVEGLPEKADKDSRHQGRIKPEYAEVQAGPGGAYLGRGRVYENDLVKILRRNEGGDWLEIESNGMRGWVRSTHIEIIRGTGPSVRNDDGGVDAGRDRRERNYEYDGRGRRLRPDGTAVGSGEGTEDDESADEAAAEEPPPPKRKPKRRGMGLRPFAGVGYGQIKRYFQSISDSPTLAKSTAQPKGMALAMGLDWDPIDYLRVGARFDGVFFGSVDLPANEELGFAKAVALDASGWQAGLDVLGRYPFGAPWAGAYGGLRIFRQNFQQTKAYPVFLTETATSIAAGVSAGAEFEVGLELGAKGGVLVPVKLSQEPTDSGELKNKSGYEVAGNLGWRLMPQLSVIAEFMLSRLDFDFVGESGQKQTFEDGREPVGYEAAREADSILGLTVGARGSF